jgi:hypothetical protein
MQTVRESEARQFKDDIAIALAENRGLKVRAAVLADELEQGRRRGSGVIGRLLRRRVP